MGAGGRRPAGLIDRTPSMDFENLTVDATGPIARVAVDRPKRLNALNHATIAELDDAFRALAGDPAVRVVVLRGAGDKAFVAGADITEIRDQSPVEARGFSRAGQALMSRIADFEKPVIAAVNGYALGGGLELALACHLRLASDTAQLGLPEIKLGIMPGFGGSQRLARLVGPARALELMLTGEPVDAATALSLGIVNHVVSVKAKNVHSGGREACWLLGTNTVVPQMYTRLAQSAFKANAVNSAVFKREQKQGASNQVRPGPRPCTGAR